LPFAACSRNFGLNLVRLSYSYALQAGFACGDFLERWIYALA